MPSPIGTAPPAISAARTSAACSGDAWMAQPPAGKSDARTTRTGAPPMTEAKWLSGAASGGTGAPARASVSAAPGPNTPRTATGRRANRTGAATL